MFAVITRRWDGLCNSIFRYMKERRESHIRGKMQDLMRSEALHLLSTIPEPGPPSQKSFGGKRCIHEFRRTTLVAHKFVTECRTCGMKLRTVEALSLEKYQALD